MAKKQPKAGWVQPTLMGYLNRRDQTLNDWIVENKLASLMHLRKKCEELNMSPPESVPRDAPWLGYKLSPPIKNAIVELPPAPKPEVVKQPVVEESSLVLSPKKKKKIVEESSSTRSALYDIQEEDKDANS